MSLLKAVPPEQAPDEMKPLYQGFMDAVGTVPPSFALLASSPALQSLQARHIGYYGEGSNLSALLQTLIRYLTAVALGMEPCAEFNAKILVALHGMSEKQVVDLQVKPATAPLDEKEGWLLAMVVKAVRAPETFTLGHVEKLMDLGWTDADILDALYLACMMVGMERLMRALKAD